LRLAETQRKLLVDKKLKTIFFLLTIGVVFFLLGVRTAKADTVTLNWTNPIATENCVAGGPYLDKGGTHIWQLVADVTDPALVSHQFNNVLPGTYTYIATAYSLTGEESRGSGKAVKAAVLFTASIGTTVYQPVSIRNGFWLLPVGTVSVATECIVGQNVNGKYAIPNTSVNWSPGVIPKPLVVTDCQ